MIESWSLCGWHSNLIKYISKEVMQSWRCFIFGSSIIYFPVSLLICTVWYFTNTSSLLIERDLRWKYGRVSTSPRQKGITRSRALGPSHPIWGIMDKTNTIRISNPLSYYMWVTILTCDFGAFDDDMVVSLTIWTLSDLENASNFTFAVIYLEWVSGGRRNLVMS